jgi:hypothetical protein
LFNLLNNDGASIYETAYGDDINIYFPELWDWLIQAFYWPYLVISVLVLVYSLRKKYFRNVVISLCVMTVVLLTINDVIILFFASEFKLSNLFQNFLANLIGGTAAGIVFSVILLCHKFLLENDITKTLKFGLLASSFALIAGLLCSTIIFYISESLYRPVPVKFDATFSLPVSGYIAVELEEYKDDKQQPFRMVPNTFLNSKIDFISPRGELNLDFKSLIEHSKFDIKMTFFNGCYRYENLTKITDLPIHQEIRGVKDFKIRFDEGHTIFSSKKTTIMPKIKFKQSLRSFELENKNPKTSNLKIQQFLQTKDSIKVKDFSEITLFLSAILIQIDQEKQYPKSAERKLMINHSKNQLGREIRFKPSENINKDENLDCKALHDLNFEADSEVEYLIDQPLAGILIRVKPSDIISTDYSRDLEFTINGGNGWLSFSEIAKEEIESAPSGYVNFISLSGTSQELQLDGKEIAIKDKNNIAIKGDITATYLDKDTLRLNGSADFIWKDSDRMNPTKWERMSWEYRTIFIGLLMSALGFLVNLVWKRMLENAKHEIIN